MVKANWTFEEQWSQALAGAEVAPPEQVWVAIDGKLANEKAIGYKKQADFYRWVAAACLLLISLSGAYYWIENSNVIPSDFVSKSETSSPTPELMKSNKSTPLVALDEEDEKENDELNSDPSTEKPSSVVSNKVDRNYIANVERQIMLSRAKKEAKLVNRKVVNHVKLYTLSSKSISFATKLEPWQAEQLFGVARTWEVIEPDKVVSPMWAGVSFSSGAFDPGFGTGSNNSLDLASKEGFSGELASVKDNTVSPVYASGRSVAGGFNLGKKLSKRFVLSSGLHYSAFNTGSATSQLVSDPENNTYALTNETSDSNLESALSDGNLSYAGKQVQLANAYQYLTVPIKAGYVLLDKKINITLNTGLSSNILIDSKLVSTGDEQDLNNDFNTSDNYESVYFNFLTSVEFGYVFKEHYQLLLEPNYNQALSEFTNSNHTDHGKPRSLGVAIGFRYNF